MWSGIEVKNGGGVEFASTSSNDNLIEDALKAIDVTNNTTNSTILEIHNTIFNKNYIDINISNYTQSVSPYPFYVDNCVFTCRDLPSSSSAWPNVKASSTSTGASAQLRTAMTTTTGLTPPFLSQSSFTITTLKNPYSNQPSHIAINLSTVGINSGTVMYGINIGTTTATNFNLFDAHGTFISAENSNVKSENNVFQNTRTYTVSGGSNYGGNAIIHSVLNQLNTALTLTGTSASLGNRFWDCHKAIDAKNVYHFWMGNSTIRSTQSSTNTGAFLPGDAGVNINTNRFDYYIELNEFTNINNSINIPIAPGSFTSGLTGTITAYGIYADRIRVVNNVFAPGTTTNNYVNNAVTITGPNNTPWDVAPDNASPFTRAVVVSNNTLTNVFRGIWVDGITGYQTAIENNTITLKNDGVFTVSQYGIKLTDTNPTSSASIGKNIIASNTVSFTTATSTTNVLGSLIYCGNNGYGICSPSVTCNKLTRGYQAFVFD